MGGTNGFSAYPPRQQVAAGLMRRAQQMPAAPMMGHADTESPAEDMAEGPGAEAMEDGVQHSPESTAQTLAQAVWERVNGSRVKKEGGIPEDNDALAAQMGVPLSSIAIRRQMSGG